MKPSEDPKLLEIVKATGEIYSKQVSITAALMFLADLDDYTSSEVSSALGRCRRELKYFPTVADVSSRIPDGHPGVEEAWSMIPKDESSSVVWTEQMRDAYAVVRLQIDSDPIAARMAFKEVYSRLLSEARASRGLPKWEPSLGFDRHSRDAALQDAVAKGRLQLEYAQSLSPHIMIEAPKHLKKFLPEIPK